MAFMAKAGIGDGRPGSATTGATCRASGAGPTISPQRSARETDRRRMMTTRRLAS